MNKQKHALVTGGSEGIGLELAKLFAQDGCNLILVARNSHDLDEVAKELQHEYGVSVHTIAKDLVSHNAAFEVYDEVKSRGIPIDILVNNAGQGVYGEFIHNDIQRELDIIQLNIGAYVILSKCFLRDMVERNEGKILNVGSIAGEVPGPWQAVYHGTKAFVHSWSEGLRNELKETNITLSILVPGATDTDFFEKADMTDSKIYEKGNLSDPAKVALDGYKGLMKGDHKIVSGLKNKAMVGLAQVMPDPMAAENMRKQQEPKDKGED